MPILSFIFLFAIDLSWSEPCGPGSCFRTCSVVREEGWQKFICYVGTMKDFYLTVMLNFNLISSGLLVSGTLFKVKC